MQLAGEAAGPVGERRLEAAGGGRHNPQGLIEPFGAARRRGRAARLGAAHVAQVRDGGEAPAAGRACSAAARGRLPPRWPALQFAPPRPQLAPPRLELQQDRLGRLAREPQFAPLRVPADPVCGDGRHLRREQLGARDDRYVDQLARVTADEHEH